MKHDISCIILQELLGNINTVESTAISTTT